VPCTGYDISKDKGCGGTNIWKICKLWDVTLRVEDFGMTPHKIYEYKIVLRDLNLKVRSIISISQRDNFMIAYLWSDFQTFYAKRCAYKFMHFLFSPTTLTLSSVTGGVLITIKLRSKIVYITNINQKLIIIQDKPLTKNDHGHNKARRWEPFRATFVKS